MSKAMNKVIEELIQEKTNAIDQVIEAAKALESANLNSLDPASNEDIKKVFQNICKFMKMDNAVVSLRNIDKADYSDIINENQ